MQNLSENLSGYLFIDKPENITSYDCIRYIKKLLPKNTKIGHAGTLDPFATGLLIIAISRESTKKLNEFIKLDKEYVATAILGQETDTLDLTGNIINTSNNSITEVDIKNAAQKLTGSYKQIPPIYSAKKHHGENLYYLARNNKIDQATLESIAKEKSKIVNIYKIEILNFDYPYFDVKTQVSSGTYIRSLINDLAKLNNSYATTQSLKRTRIGNYKINDSVKLADIKNLQDLKDNLKNNLI